MTNLHRQHNTKESMCLKIRSIGMELKDGNTRLNINSLVIECQLVVSHSYSSALASAAQRAGIDSGR